VKAECRDQRCPWKEDKKHPPSASIADIKSVRKANGIVAFLTILLLLIGPAAFTRAATGHVTRIPVGHTVIPTTKFACYHRTIHRFTAEVDPGRCEVAGVADGRGFVRFPIEGEWERIGWSHWGDFKSLSNEAINSLTKGEVRIVAYRRVRCADGSTWYSLANVFSLVGSYNAVIRLPVCGDPRLID
jgi:hypothetical protein